MGYWNTGPASIILGHGRFMRDQDESLPHGILMAFKWDLNNHHSSPDQVSRCSSGGEGFGFGVESLDESFGSVRSSFCFEELSHLNGQYD